MRKEDLAFAKAKFLFWAINERAIAMGRKKTCRLPKILKSEEKTLEQKTFTLKSKVILEFRNNIKFLIKESPYSRSVRLSSDQVYYVSENVINITGLRTNLSLGENLSLLQRSISLGFGRRRHPSILDVDPSVLFRTDEVLRAWLEVVGRKIQIEKAILNKFPNENMHLDEFRAHWIIVFENPEDMYSSFTIQKLAEFSGAETEEGDEEELARRPVAHTQEARQDLLSSYINNVIRNRGS